MAYRSNGILICRFISLPYFCCIQYFAVFIRCLVFLARSKDENTFIYSSILSFASSLFLTALLSPPMIHSTEQRQLLSLLSLIIYYSPHILSLSLPLLQAPIDETGQKANGENKRPAGDKEGGMHSVFLLF
jgi:hypothetical protein